MTATHECILRTSGELASCCLGPQSSAGGPDRSGSACTRGGQQAPHMRPDAADGGDRSRCSGAIQID